MVGLYIAIIKDLPFEWQGMAEVALSHADLRQGANMLTCYNAFRLDETLDSPTT